MAENLNYKTENSYCYGNADSNCVKYGRFWSSSEYNDNGDRSRAFSLSLDYNSDYVGLVTANKSDAALSVRCIKD